MILYINSEKIYSYLKDDPVRPLISSDLRMEKNGFVFSFMSEQLKPMCILCSSVQDNIPIEENELFQSKPNSTLNVAVFYSVWTYIPGNAGNLIHQAKSYFTKMHDKIKRFVTLSPKTEMAKKFHLKNGASVLRINENTINYEYKK